MEFKITIRKEDNKMFIDTEPEITNENAVDFLNCYMYGLRVALEKYSETIPTIRPATKKEVELSTYIFKDDDSKTYDHIKKLYDNISGELNFMLSQIFPEVLYIEATKKYYTEMAFNGTQKEYKKYLEQLKKLTKEINNE